MRINDKEIAREYRVVQIPRQDGALTVKVHALPLGVKSEFDKMFPLPQVPKIVTGTKTGDISKDNFEDPAWLAEVTERRSLESYFRLYHALSLDQSVHFDNIPKDRVSLAAFRDEVINSGLSDGDVLIILRAATEAGNISNADIEAAKSGF